MNLLFAHHDIQPLEYPVLAVMFAAGFWIGWDVIAKLLAPRPTPAIDNGHADEGNRLV